MKHCDLARPCLQDLETKTCEAAGDSLWDFSAGLESAKKNRICVFFFLAEAEKALHDDGF